MAYTTEEVLTQQLADIRREEQRLEYSKTVDARVAALWEKFPNLLQLQYHDEVLTAWFHEPKAIVAPGSKAHELIQNGVSAVNADGNRSLTFAGGSGHDLGDATTWLSDAAAVGSGKLSPDLEQALKEFQATTSWSSLPDTHTRTWQRPEALK
jgi:hypothetical protein